jgi:hypothetical protein
MNQVVKDPEKLVTTEAEVPPPPDVTVPEPPDPALVREVRALADRVGGLEKLRELVDGLMRSQG